MKLVFLSDNMNFSGGRKLLLEYACFLTQKKHDVKILTREKRGSLQNFTNYKIVDDFDRENIPECDLIIVSTPREAEQAVKSNRAKVVHFCQGFEITDLEQRIQGLVLPERFQGGGIKNKIRVFRKKFSWRKKLSRIDRQYRLPTEMITVSEHLKNQLEKRYGKKVRLCRNGIHDEFFYPAQDFTIPEFTDENPLRIINVGPLDVTFKGIEDTLKAIEMLKEKNLPVHFIRVAPKLTETDKKHPAIDELHESMTQVELADLMRSCHVYISNSTEGEGFGLPAMEALSCGLICVLSSISSYIHFSDSENFCFFVPEHSPRDTSKALSEIIKSSPDELVKIRNKALEVSKAYSFSTSCEKFENILFEIQKNSP